MEILRDGSTILCYANTSPDTGEVSEEESAISSRRLSRRQCQSVDAVIARMLIQYLMVERT